ncbi:MAG: L,D-transpeptidase, partial [Cyanobium sp.]
MHRSLAGLLATVALPTVLQALPAGAIQPPPPVPGAPQPQTASPASAASPPSGKAIPAPAPPSTTAAISSTREIVLELGKRTISLVDSGKVLGRWPVAIGDPATPTPIGRYNI